MVMLAERVDHVECAHALEADVREQRLIAVHQPPYNRRSRTPGCGCTGWSLTDEPFPRLSIVRATARTGPPACLGPFTSRAAAQSPRWRPCRTRCRSGGARPGSAGVDPDGSPCALAELGRCGAPCSGAEDIDATHVHVDRIAELVDGRSDELLGLLRGAAAPGLSRDGRFDQAAVPRDRLSALAEAVDRRQRLGALAGIARDGGRPARRSRRVGSDGDPVRPACRGRAGPPRGRSDAGGRPAGRLGRDRAARSRDRCRAPRPEETTTLLRWIERPGSRLVLHLAAVVQPGGRRRSLAAVHAAADMARGRWAGGA